MVEKKSETKKEYCEAVGRRKRAVAVVRLVGKGGPTFINDKPIEEYFPGEPAKIAYREPFRVTETEGKFSGTVKVSGGGKGAQLGAVILGFARALVTYDEKFRQPLRQAGLLTRDPREKEPKKYFLRKARKRPQYSKR
ncbi:30S ribosomal protein S9 [candidate division WWE3 bacterium CG09_land_8_20_14_0_10_47_33]|uniref:30S ribosomal protein S9 n=1 Tax=candidate division WWE3 bacterium CG_4_9_14_0_2_um_filter_48_10 TaxID=1975078 RepID=A0A2M8EJP7_UNCKA|nr:MAG: 30S ribosomal protein S9 [candidate division WWE3 bacterium CG09_land_8_20_14_0_10_47_33]PJC22972.1 MAG: 30S ribosomal protein S9 [candidate division WWE3 bacterium CG_4_9_14_0_2_um_filter_48_10]PJE51214.1 MAG: 30S ribosomal protein S9 [candidate division WWE3 bacterium CG10_big_fil_rev_8_21_14_0_10_48_23]